MDFASGPAHLSFFERNVAQRRWHCVHFYESDAALVDNSCRFLVPAIRSAFESQERADAVARIYNAHSHVHAT